jgi:hypothetical protein
MHRKQDAECLFPPEKTALHATEQCPCIGRFTLPLSPGSHPLSFCGSLPPVVAYWKCEERKEEKYLLGKGVPASPPYFVLYIFAFVLRK